MPERAEAISAAIDVAAQREGLNPRVVRAVVEQESGGDPFAFRPEPRFRYFVNCLTGQPFRALSPDEIASKVAPPDFPRLAGSRDQEWWLQQASIGLCQVMGAVAREQGCRAPFLLALCDPETNLLIGCRILAGNVRWAAGDLRRALGAYNAGRGNASGSVGRAYADKILARLV